MKVNPTTVEALAHAAEVIRYQNKLMEVKRAEEHLRQEKLRMQRIRPNDPTKGQSVDITV